MTTGPRSDRFGIIIAVLGGLFVALAAVLVVLLVTGGDESPTAGSSSTQATLPDDEGTETTLDTLDTTTAPATTAAPATTTAPATTAAPATTMAPTTTAPGPSTFTAGSLVERSGPVQGSPTGRLIDIRYAEHPFTDGGYTRVVFDFSPGGVPGYNIGYIDAAHLQLIVYPTSWSNPYDWGIFNSSGEHYVGMGSIVSVHDGDQGAGSGEWVYLIEVTAQKPFRVGTEEATFSDPPRIYVDLGY